MSNNPIWLKDYILNNPICNWIICQIIQSGIRHSCQPFADFVREIDLNISWRSHELPI